MQKKWRGEERGGLQQTATGSGNSPHASPKLCSVQLTDYGRQESIKGVTSRPRRVQCPPHSYLCWGSQRLPPSFPWPLNQGTRCLWEFQQPPPLPFHCWKRQAVTVKGNVKQSAVAELTAYYAFAVSLVAARITLL